MSIERLMAYFNAGSGASTGFRYLALAVAWLLLWRVSALMEYAPYASIWFPPAGLSFAALLLMGWRAVPVLMVCSVLVTFWTAWMYGQAASVWELLLSGLLFGLAHCLSYGLGAEFIRRMTRRSVVQSTPVIILLFLITCCVSALVAALTEINVLSFTGMLDAGTDPGLWLPWWIGDMAGALVLTPLFLGLLSWRYPQIEAWMGGLNFNLQSRGRREYLAKLGLSIALVSVVNVSAANFGYREVAFAMFFLIIPQMWIVYTESPFRSAVSLAVFSTATALWVAALGLVEHALIYQFAICVIAASVCFGFAVPVLLAQNNQLRDLAFTDGLTRVATKERFFDSAAEILSYARSAGQAVALVVLDVDHFKMINDDYGHVTGDHALVELVRSIRSKLRKVDLIGRFGGDEFTLLLPGLDCRQAEHLTLRIRQHLKQTGIPGTVEFFSASFGVVGIGETETVMQAFVRADQQLLKAKQQLNQAAKPDDPHGRSHTIEGFPDSPSPL